MVKAPDKIWKLWVQVPPSPIRVWPFYFAKLYDMKLDFDFLNLYGDLSMLNEGIILDEAHEHGRYKKAFINFLNGAYYNNGIQNADKVENNRTGSKGTIDAIAATKKIDLKIDDQTDLEYKDKVKKVNDRLKNSRQRAIPTHKEIIDGEEVQGFTVFNIKPSVLHHINGEHGDNITNIKGTQRTSLVVYDPKNPASLDKAIGNYALIRANSVRNAAQAHKLVHLLAMISDALRGLDDSNNVILNIAKTFEKTLADKEVTFNYIDSAGKVQRDKTFVDFILATTWGNTKSTNALLTEHEKFLREESEKAIEDEPVEQEALAEVTENNVTEALIADYIK